MPQAGEAKKFTRHERDFGRQAGTTDDLDFMHARYCSPAAGRFLTTDPIIALKRSLRRPVAWDRYRYAIGNPPKYVDPCGHVFVLSACAGGKSSEECTKQKGLLEATLGKVGTNFSEPTGRPARGAQG